MFLSSPVFSKGVTCAVLKQEGKLPSYKEYFTILVIGFKSTPQSRTKGVGIGSKSHDLFGVDFMILKISFSDMVRKKTHLLLQEPGTGGSASVDHNSNLSLEIFVKLLIIV